MANLGKKALIGLLVSLVGPGVSCCYAQSRLATGIWVDPFEVSEPRYREIAEAGFNTVFGGFGAVDASKLERQLKFGQQFQLDIVPSWTRRFGVSLLDTSAHTVLVQDEPRLSSFGSLGKTYAEVAAQTPGIEPISILFPLSGTDPGRVKEYQEYLLAYSRLPGVKRVVYNHYPSFYSDSSKTNVDGYRNNLAVVSTFSRTIGLPFWNFVLSMPLRDRLDPTYSQISWQVYLSLAYGSSGLVYFCYWTPSGAEFPRGGGIILGDGTRGPHYDQVTELNRRAQNIYQELDRRSLLQVQRIDTTKSTTLTQPSLLTKVEMPLPGEKGVFTVADFTGADGSQRLLIVNDDFNQTSWPTISFADARGISELDLDTGTPTKLVDASPRLAGIQLLFQPGSARMLLRDKP